MYFWAMPRSPFLGWRMPHKFLIGPRVADGQRYDRFVATTQRIGVLDDVKGFEQAFKNAFETAAACWGRAAGHQLTMRRSVERT